MNFLQATPHWSLRTRLALVACLSLLLGAVPGALLLRAYAAQLDTAAQQHQALPANRAWRDCRTSAAWPPRPCRPNRMPGPGPSPRARPCRPR
jgi:hypothetical protein